MLAAFIADRALVRMYFRTKGFALAFQRCAQFIVHFELVKSRSGLDPSGQDVPQGFSVFVHEAAQEFPSLLNDLKALRVLLKTLTRESQFVARVIEFCEEPSKACFVIFERPMRRERLDRRTEELYCTWVQRADEQLVRVVCGLFER